MLNKVRTWSPVAVCVALSVLGCTPASDPTVTSKAPSSATTSSAPATLSPSPTSTLTDAQQGALDALTSYYRDLDLMRQNPSEESLAEVLAWTLPIQAESDRNLMEIYIEKGYRLHGFTVIRGVGFSAPKKVSGLDGFLVTACQDLGQAELTQNGKTKEIEVKSVETKVEMVETAEGWRIVEARTGSDPKPC